MSTPAKFATYVRYKTRTSSTTFPDAEMLSYMELRQDEVAKEIIRVDEDILLIPQTQDLVASSITAREYPLPTDILSRIKRVDAQLDGSTWVPLTEIDINDIRKPIATETNITDVFNNFQMSETNPAGARFDMLRKSIFIYSGTITATTDGLKVYVKTWPATITSLLGTTDMSIDPSTTTHGIPRAMHEIWARGVIIDYKESKEKPIPLSQRELKYEMDLKKAVAALKHGNLGREVIGDLPPGSDRGNEGADY